MTKQVTGRGQGQPMVRTPSTEPSSSTKKPTTSDKLKDKKSAQRTERPQVQRQQRQQRAQGAHNAGGAHGAGVTDEAGEAEGGGGAHSVSAAEEAEDLHRRRGGHVEEAYETQDERVERVEEVLDSAATGDDAIKRSKGGGQNDGFDQGGGERQQREAYERLLKGNVKNDDDRFAELRKKGLKDDFKPDAAPADVEKSGVPRVAAHVVRLFDNWTLAGLSRAESVEKMALWLSQLSSPQTIKKVLAELESKPIRDVYPLELFMHLLEHRPALTPHVKKGAVLGNLDELNDNKKIFAGHGIQIQVPVDMRLKSFALLGGARPGYEFFPTPGADDRYTLLIDTPGRWTFALLAVQMVQIARIQKEGSDAILQLFQVTVNAMGKKGEPISPEDWLAQQEAEAGDLNDDDADEDAAADDVDLAPKAEPAPLLILQIRTALEAVTRDATSTSTATTYSWDLRLYAPGAAKDGEGILHLVVKNAGPFDPVWHKAREAIVLRQREHEPGRALLTNEDIQNAIRRARVR